MKLVKSNKRANVDFEANIYDEGRTVHVTAYEWNKGEVTLCITTDARLTMSLVIDAQMTELLIEALTAAREAQKVAA